MKSIDLAFFLVIYFYSTAISKELSHDNMIFLKLLSGLLNLQTKLLILRLLTFFMFYYDITTITISMYTALNSISLCFTNTLFFINFFFSFQLPGRKGSGSGGWSIQAKVQIYLWLGSLKHKKNYPSGLPPGFQPTNELLNAERPGLPPPNMIHYAEKHVSCVPLTSVRILVGLSFN